MKLTKRILVMLSLALAVPAATSGKSALPYPITTEGLSDLKVGKRQGEHYEDSLG